MPTYSYRCTACDNAFDIHQAFTEDSLTVCPVCGDVLRKVFSPVGITFSGSGFYRTDSRAKPASESTSSTPAPAAAPATATASPAASSTPSAGSSSKE